MSLIVSPTEMKWWMCLSCVSLVNLVACYGPEDSYQPAPAETTGVVAVMPSSTGASAAIQDDSAVGTGALPNSDCAAPLAEEMVSSLGDAYATAFSLGAALEPSVFSGGAAADLVTAHFNQISPENLFKWDAVHPQPGVFDFTVADEYVSFGQAHQLKIHGHVMLWHQQTPDWVFQGEDGLDVSAELLWSRFEEHLSVLAERYGEAVAVWDIVNEAFLDDGRLRDSPWLRILGEDYIAGAFERAAAVLPNTSLLYNDYSMFLPGKRRAAIALVQDLRARGIRIDGVGMQGHYNLARPTFVELDGALQELADAKIPVYITELDLNVLPSERDIQGADLDATEDPSALLDPYSQCLPSAHGDLVAEYWAEFFKVFVKHRETIVGVTFWGVNDGQSWLNNWPIEGRTNYPLLFDRDSRPKLSFQAVLEQAPQL